MTGAADRSAKTCSGGIRRRLDLAATRVGHVRVLFLTSRLPGSTRRPALWAAIRSLVDRGSTAVLTTQYLEEADQLADRIVVFDQG
jgi:ABC-type multidrug transport system ATPase subunit